MSDIRQTCRALVARILEGDARTSRAQRQGAFDNAGLAPPLSVLVEKVAVHFNGVTDDDIEAVRSAGFNEDQIFEIVVCAAVGQTTRLYDAASDSLSAAIEGA